MTADQLAAAVRYLDNKTVSDGGEKVFEDLGVTMDTLLYLAQQRAIRSIFIMVRSQPLPQKMQAIELTEFEHYLEKLLMASEIDGMAIALAAAKGLAAPLPPSSSEN